MNPDERLSPQRRLLIGIVVALCAAVGFGAGRALLRPRHRVVQPVAFNHKLHVTKAKLECKTCHLYVTTGQHAGLPLISSCGECHDDPDVKSAEERKVVALAQKGTSETFHKLFHLPEHVYYSHRRHVGLGGLQCVNCHGGIAETTSPPTAPLVRVDMSFCLDCHKQRGISTDCTHCHR